MYHCLLVHCNCPFLPLPFVLTHCKSVCYTGFVPKDQGVENKLKSFQFEISRKKIKNLYLIGSSLPHSSKDNITHKVHFYLVSC